MVAATYLEEVKSLGDFDQATLDEALNAARALRQRSADRLAGPVADEQHALMQLRNRMVSALVRKMRNVRRAFRFVFRDYPDLARKAGSDYVRNQRRRHRRSDDEDVTVEAPTGTAVPSAPPKG